MSYSRDISSGGRTLGVSIQVTGSSCLRIHQVQIAGNSDFNGALESAWRRIITAVVKFAKKILSVKQEVCSPR